MPAVRLSPAAAKRTVSVLTRAPHRPFSVLAQARNIASALKESHPHTIKPLNIKGAKPDYGRLIRMLGGNAACYFPFMMGFFGFSYFCELGFHGTVLGQWPSAYWS